MKASQSKESSSWWLAIWIFLAIHTIIVAFFCGWELKVSHMIDYGELEVLNAVHWWRQGVVPPYSSPNQLPVSANHYGPIYEGLCALLPSLCHPYFIGRIVSLLATISILLAVSFWTFYWTRNLACAWLATLLLLTAKPLFSFAVLHRVDMLAIAFSVSGFILVLLARGWLPAAIGAILMSLGFHTKLTIVAAPIACVAALWNKERPKALFVGIIWFALAIGGVAFLQFMTNGNYLRHAVLGNEPSLWLKPFDMLTRPLTSSPFWVALALYAWRKLSQHERATIKAEVFYLIVALFIAGATSTNPGSSWNYLLEFYVALAMLTGRSVHMALKKDTTQTAVSVLLVTHALFAILHTGYFCAKDAVKIQNYQKEFLEARAKFGLLFANSSRVAVIGCGSAMDVALSFNLPNHAYLPGSMNEYAEKLAIDALQREKLDLVIVAKDNKVKVITREQLVSSKAGGLGDNLRRRFDPKRSRRY